jgi:hypothetical protein
MSRPSDVAEWCLSNDPVFAEALSVWVAAVVAERAQERAAAVSGTKNEED